MAALLLPVFSFKFLIAALIIAEYVGCDAIVFVFFVIDAFFIVVFFGLFAGDLAIVGIVVGAVVVVAVIFQCLFDLSKSV
jgi:hypothetical protein